eukprot:TRINITY_DN1487_c2_g1_i1.p1 TRINITY_DN1487_c2_g1~~TRINITY_DN1487_c2_g1_i1.p1  ORF type:complete len:445 (+),score=19.65 TRINITY_DN1487_c2_g1_i1:192-1337(+)
MKEFIICQVSDFRFRFVNFQEYIHWTCIIKDVRLLDNNSKLDMLLTLNEPDRGAKDVWIFFKLQIVLHQPVAFDLPDCRIPQLNAVVMRNLMDMLNITISFHQSFSSVAKVILFNLLLVGLCCQNNLKHNIHISSRKLKQELAAPGTEDSLPQQFIVSNDNHQNQFDQVCLDLSEAQIVRKIFEKSSDIVLVQSLNGSDACAWEQVLCNEEDKVIELDFYKFLTDYPDNANTIPPEISCLRFLEEIDLSYNNLVGVIPPEMSVLTSLTDILFYDNQMTGTLPRELSELNWLYYYKVYSNQLSGTLPAEYSVWGYRGSRVWVTDNKFSGTVPIQFSTYSQNRDASQAIRVLSIFPQNGSLCANESVELVEAISDFRSTGRFC